MELATNIIRHVSEKIWKGSGGDWKSVKFKFLGTYGKGI